MAESRKVTERRTRVDEVFDFLHDEIMSLRLLPGTKLSEAEVAEQFEFSRQPVRDAFSRLETLNLLLIRPQKATVVRRFSSNTIKTGRYVRAAVESDVLRRAAKRCDLKGADLLAAEIEKQRVVVKDNDYDRFRPLDYEFHKALCVVADVDFAFDVIAREKAKVDRLCVLGLAARNERLEELLADHVAISENVANNDQERAVSAGMLHLSRLDVTISDIQKMHANYFED